MVALRCAHAMVMQRLLYPAHAAWGEAEEAAVTLALQHVRLEHVEPWDAEHVS